VIQGYSDETSGFSGDQLTFHVATNAPQFRIDFYRQGTALQNTGVSTPWFDGQSGDTHEPDQDWGQDATRRDGQFVAGWQAYPFTIPDDWQTGVYIAMFVEGDGNGNPDPNQSPPLDRTTADARSGKALFVVKNQDPGYDSQILYKLPLFTYQMYNSTSYPGQNPLCGSGYQNYWVTLRRPGGGTGGTPWDVICFDPPNKDPLDFGSFRQTFAHWDAKMISWLESNEFRVDYCTDMDIHLDNDLSLLSPYAVVLSVGHDEYYSTEMRDHLETFIANGGNIAFFSGNTCYWRLTFPVRRRDRADLRFITRDFQWADRTSQGAPARPEDSLTGVGFRHGGERNNPLPSNGQGFVGYKVQNTQLWPFEQVGLAEDETFGHDAGLVGYECDGTPFDPNAPRPVSPSFNPEDETPDGLVILGTADGDVDSWNQPGLATMAMYNDTGTVFTAGTTDWPRLLAAGDLPTIAITRNVMNRLGGNRKGLASLGNVPNLVCCDGFFSSNNNFRHAVVGTGEGQIIEFPYSPSVGQTQGITTYLNPFHRGPGIGVIDLGAFMSEDDQLWHVVAIDFQRYVWDISWDANNQPQARMLANIADALCIAGFYTADDKRRHAIVGTKNGDVIEIYYESSGTPQTALLGTFNGLTDVGGFFSPDDRYRHAIVGTADGTVTEIYFNPDFGIFQANIAAVPDLARVSGYYADGDRFYNRRVQVLTNGGRVHEVRYNPDFGIMRVVLFNPGPLVDIGGFYTGDDDYRHSIFATPDGDVQELYFRP